MLLTSTRARLGRMAVLAALCFILIGCGKSKVTKDNFDKIQNDMTLEQVEGILGEGKAVGGDAAVMPAQVGVDLNAGARPSATAEYVWESGKQSITVTFRGGKVVQKRSSGL
jgi:hypothetical protein